jgi:hypothetical protein
MLITFSSFVYAGNGMESESFVYQGNKIHVDLTEITSAYNIPINVTYPNGTSKVFVPLASLVGKRMYVFNGINTSQIGNYYFSSRDVTGQVWQTSTYVDVLSSDILRSTINFVPSGMSFGVINKTFRHDWIISNPFDSVTMSAGICKIYSSDDESYIVNAGVVDVYSNKRVSSETNLSSQYFSVGKNYYSNCSVTVTYGSTSASINHMTQYIYVTRERQLYGQLDNLLNIEALQYNKTLKMLNITNQSYLNSKRIFNLSNLTYRNLLIVKNDTRLIKNISINLQGNLSRVRNISNANQGILNSIVSSLSSIWNSIFGINRTINRINSTVASMNHTIVTNNTYIIQQLRKDSASAIS